MKRQHISNIMVVFSITVFVFISASSALSNCVPYLSWRNEPANSIVVNWWNPYAAGDSTVQFGLTADCNSTVNIPAVSNFHHVELTGLSPSTTYHYRISSSDGTTGTDNTFTTAGAMTDANTFSFSFAVFGDPRGLYNYNEPYYTRHRAVCDWIASGGYKFALQTGDTVWAGAKTVQQPLTAQNYFLDFFDIEKNLCGSKAILATMGSHETQSPVPGETVTYAYYYDLYRDVFAANGASIDVNNRVYSFNYGNAHFVSLSSYVVDVTAQKNWLISDLTAARANQNIKWIIVFMHAPLYTTNGHTVTQSMVDAWAPVFEQYGVDLVFASHNHCYERSYPIRGGQVAADGNAPIYITNGMGGAEFNPTLPSPLFAARYGSEVVNAGTLVTAVIINGNSLTVNTIKNATDELIDSFTIAKPAPCSIVDLDGDCIVDSNDLKLFFNSWLNSGMWP
jgi:acid phosphatase type 7